MTYNCKLQYSIYFFVTVHNFSIFLTWSTVQIHIKKKILWIKIITEIYRHWPVEWHTNMSQFMWSKRTRRSLLVTLNLTSNVSASMHNTEKCHESLANSNDYWHFTYDQKRSGRNFLQTSLILTVSTQCYNTGHYKEGDIHTNLRCGFGGLEVACWPLVPNFAGSNPAKAVGIFRAKKSSAHLPSERK